MLLGSVTPSLLGSLQACPLRVDFRLKEPAEYRTGNPSAVLGRVAHAVLDEAVREEAWTGDWRPRLDELWTICLNREISAMRARSDQLADVPADRWPDVQLKRARLNRVFASICDLISEAGPAHEVLTEAALIAASGRIRGRADVIVRSPTLHVIVDYKSGAVAGDDGLPMDDYVTQVQLYGYLEHERVGAWPSAAYLMPFDQAPIRIPITQASATLAGADALRELESFNERAQAGAAQPAKPAPDTCRYCSFAPKCEAFWAACSPDWADRLLATRGTVTRIARGQLPVVGLEIEASGGNLPGTPVRLRQLPLDDHPHLRSASVGDTVAATGLAAEPSRGTFRLMPWGHVGLFKVAGSAGGYG